MAKPLFPALASSPSAESDEALAASFSGGAYNVIGDLSDGDELVFEFIRADGSCERYSGRALKGMTWWYWLPEKHAHSIEATIFFEERTGGVAYVARGDLDAGGRLIRGSRLSAFYEGASIDQVWQKCQELQGSWPDAGVYHADSVQDAERLLAASDPADESSRMRAARADAARARRLGALLS